MNLRKSTLGRKTLALLDKYSIVVSALVIYGYYLLTSIDLLESKSQHHSFLDFFLQFDSLFFLWVIAALLIQLQKYRRNQEAQNDYRKKIEHDYEKQRLHLQILDDVTQTLQDSVNNPLATISISSHTIRRKHEEDAELTSWLDRIDASLKSIHTSLTDTKAYQTQKIVQKYIPRKHEASAAV